MSGVAVSVVVLADTFDDPENARVILLSAAGLVILGLLIAAGTVWWWRSSEVEHPALGPLEVMGSRSWWKGDYASRRRRLEDARPTGAEPVEPLTTSPSEPVDLEASALAVPQEFDDLLEFPLAAVAVTDADAVAEAQAGEAATDEPSIVAGEDAELVTTHDDTTVAQVPRPIDPLLRLHHDA